MIYPIHERLNRMAVVEDRVSPRTKLCKMTGTQKSVGTQRKSRVARLAGTCTKMPVAQPNTNSILH